MNSSKIVAALLLAGAMTAAAPAMAQQPAPAPTDPTKLVTHIPKVTPAAVKAIQTLQNAVNANNTAEIPAALAAAQAAADTATAGAAFRAARAERVIPSSGS